MLIEDTLKRWLGPLGGYLPPLYLVGGAVRDHRLRRPPRDLDLLCADPEPFARRLATAHNTAVVPFYGKSEAPCFRVVRRAAPLDFLDIVGIQGGSLQDDLVRRDFTFNAMAAPVSADGRLGHLIDPLGGLQDLYDRCVRAVRPDAFARDPLRVVRAVRFAAELACDIDPATFDMMRTAAAGLTATAGERVSRELRLVLQHPSSARYVRMLDEAGALRALFPVIGRIQGCVQNDHHHLDVWGHSLAALAACEELLQKVETQFGAVAPALLENLGRENRLPILKLALLLHDAGKPESRTIDPTTGRIVFHGHAPHSAELAAAAAERLKLSIRERELLETLVANHMSAIDLARPAVKPGTLLRWFRRLGADMVPLVVLSMADVAATRGPGSVPAERERHMQWARDVLGLYFGSLRQRLAAKPLIGGEDLIAMGLAPGPELGRILREVREAQDEGAITTREEALKLGRSLMG